ncbi:MAG TPA: Uma2 family endonuclease [Caulifigura sp.]|jgi:Uma2 family endonuclease|nr:Uma2 family endonuclease [Caulifigura sp.]
MTAAPKRVSVADYLAMERRSETKHEYFAGQIFAMAGASYVHTLLAANATAELRAALRDTDCNVVSSDLRIRTLNELYTYPDAVVVCGKPVFDDEQRDTLTNPIAIVEVLSESTEGYDRGQKFLHYRSIPSLREYVLISQRQMLVEHFARQANGQWVLTTFSGPEETVVFPTLDVSIPIASLYLKVDLPASPSLRDDGDPMSPSPS